MRKVMQDLHHPRYHQMKDSRIKDSCIQMYIGITLSLHGMDVLLGSTRSLDGSWYGSKHGMSTNAASTGTAEELANILRAQGRLPEAPHLEVLRNQRPQR